MYITKETYYAHPKTERPSGSTASERQGVRNEADYQDKNHQRVAFFTKNGFAVCEDGRWANGGAFSLEAHKEEPLEIKQKVALAFQALRASGLKYNGGFEVRNTHTPPAPKEVDPSDKYDTKSYAEKSLAIEIAEKKAQIRQLEQELKVLQGLVGNRLKI